MPSKSELFFKVLLNKFHPDANEPFLHQLPASEAKKINALQITSEHAEAAILWEQQIIFNTHYSWLAKIILQMQENQQRLIIGALLPSQASKLQSHLKINTVTTHLPPFMKAFLLAQLFRKWNPPSPIPKAFLSPSPLLPLLDYSKSQLIVLIDLLSMYDLADVLRTIIDKKKLDSLYQSLLPRNQQFLRLCLHQKEKIKAPKLDIDQWKGDKDTLTALLQSRGMLRLGKAICGQEPQFMWHLTHILDTGRGQVLTKYYLEKPIPNITSHLILQLKFAMNFMKKKAPRE